MNYLKKASLPKRGRKRNEEIKVEVQNTSARPKLSINPDDLDWDAMIDELELEEETDGKA